MKIEIEFDGTWWDWRVEDDPNSRAGYCGGAIDLQQAMEAITEAIKEKKRHPFNYNVRTEY